MIRLVLILIAMIYRIELADRSGNRLEYLEREALGLRWEYSQIGGCGNFSFNLPRELCNEKYISGDFNIKILRRNQLTQSYDLWYQGLIEKKLPSINGAGEEIIKIQGHGYAVQLGRIRFTRTYLNTEISVIVKDILDDFVVPNTQITYTPADIEVTTFIPDKFEFKNQTCYQALKTLADTTGTREWGVDRNKKFFFKERSEAVGFEFPASGGKLVDFDYEDDFPSIINHVIIQGGDVSGTPYFFEGDHPQSQLKYGRRDEVIENSAIVTNAVAQQFRDAIFSEFSDVANLRIGSGRLVDYETLLEETTPLGLFLPLVRGTTYGEKQYGTFLYSGRLYFQLNRISYSVPNEGGALDIGLSLGRLRPADAEFLSRIENKIEALRTSAL